MPRTDPSVRSAAYAIVAAIVADRKRVLALARDVTAWVTENPGDDVPGHELAWVAARAVNVGLEAVDSGDETALQPEQLEVLRSLPLAAQVAVALHHFVELDLPAVARLTDRPLKEVKLLVVSEREGVSRWPLPDSDPVLVKRPVKVAAKPPAATPVVTMPGTKLRVRKPPPKKRNAPRAWFIIVAVMGILIAAGIAANSADHPAQSAKPTKQPVTGPAQSVTKSHLSEGCKTDDGHALPDPETVKTTFGGGREYRIVAPTEGKPHDPRSLVIDFTDVGESVTQHVAETKLDEVAKSLSNVVLITPVPATAIPQWNVGGTAADPDDAGFVSSIISDQQARLCLDTSRIVVAGQGQGAHFAAAYACAHPGQVGGLIMIAGALHPKDCQSATNPVWILGLVGDKDDWFPLLGGKGPAFESFAQANGGLNEGSAAYDIAPTMPVFKQFATDFACGQTESKPIGLPTLTIATSCKDGVEVWNTKIQANHQWFEISDAVISDFLTSGPFAPDAGSLAR